MILFLGNISDTSKNCGDTNAFVQNNFPSVDLINSFQTNSEHKLVSNVIGSQNYHNNFSSESKDASRERKVNLVTKHFKDISSKNPNKSTHLMLGGRTTQDVECAI